MTTKEENIPEDVLEAARSVYEKTWAWAYSQDSNRDYRSEGEDDIQDIARAILAERERCADRIAELEDELHDAQQVPWPEWADKILKLVRSYSGYDGYDDATDGVDIVGEVDEALSELYAEAERLRNSPKK